MIGKMTLRSEIIYWIASHLPKDIQEWAAVNVAVNAAIKNPQRECSSITITEMLQNW